MNQIIPADQVISAVEAHRLSSKTNELEQIIQLRLINIMITKAAREGHVKIELIESLHLENRAKLEALGYDIQTHINMDEFTVYHTVISWFDARIPDHELAVL